jgi:hypothetical protein
MYSKSFVSAAAAAVLLACAAPALAANFTDERDRGNNEHTTLLDEEYARTHPTIIPGTPPALMGTRSTYGYVLPHRPKAKRTVSHGN